MIQTTRAKAIDIRTYCRPKDSEGTEFESRDEMLFRSMFEHHHNLYCGANGTKPIVAELNELVGLGFNGKAAVSGRTQWLGGTPYAYSRAACQFNCAFTKVSTVYDLVDASWLLLNGCGVGFKPQMGTLHGYNRPIENLEIVPSTQPSIHKGDPNNKETLPTEENGFTWTIKLGDSASAWAKAVAKMFVPQQRRVDKLTLDFSDIRGSGGRLKGYGWICNGYKPLAEAMRVFHQMLNANAGNLLDDITIGDICNWWGTVLSSRRAAEIWLMDSHNPKLAEFQRLKFRYWEHSPQRRQSNNTVLYWNKPSLQHLEDLLYASWECGGCPAICNANAALQRCPWFEGLNPCAEILLANKGFCNLVTMCLPRFKNNFAGLERAAYLMGRANYRQTCVDLRDGILQPGWHQTNEALRLCGVSVTGVTQADWLTDHQIRRLKNSAITGTYSMADELKRPRPKAVCTLKPEGTISKTLGGTDIGDIAEGLHRPPGQWIFNWVNFSVHDPLVSLLEAAGYRTLLNPSDSNNVLVCFPVEYKGVKFDIVDGKPVNMESAVTQFNRYLRWNRLWCDYNASCTISINYDEIPQLAKSIYDNWDTGFIAVSVLQRSDPTRTAKDLGHPYLPQEVVTEDVFRSYDTSLRSVDWNKVSGIYEIGEEACSTGACPVK